MSNVPVITPDWSAAQNIVAYTTTRAGGVSVTPFASLNVGDHVGDIPASVNHNRARLPFSEHIHWLKQVHGDRVVTLPTPVCEADAAISRTPGAFCAVMTADCVPILVSNLSGTEVAAIHAGWKGLESGIIANTINAMHSDASALIAWIGPAISADNYEVDNKLAQRFYDVPNAVLTKAADKALLDLPLIAQWQLCHAGVSKVVQSQHCTYADDARFYSHRRATHAGQSATGRIVSVIGIR